MTNEILEPVYIKNNDKLIEKWLQVTEKNISDPRNIRTILTDTVEPIKEPVFTLLDTSIYKCCRCGATVKSEKKPTFCLQCERDSDFTIVFESIEIQKSLWKIPTWKNIDLDMFEVYDNIIELLKKTIKFVDPIQYKIFTLWIIATYKHPYWETIPYLHFKGLPVSGKTRSMEMAYLLGYRAVLTSGITFTGIVRINHNYNATLLIDEIDTKVDERTETGREYIAFLKPGYKKGSLYIASDLNDQKKVVCYNNYGPKILSGEKGIYNEALVTRSITFDMEQDYPEIYSLSEVYQECEQLKTQLLNYRFKTSMPDILKNDIPLKARNREIFDCLLRTAQHIGQPIDDLLEYAIKLEESVISDMQDTVEWDILNILFDETCKTQTQLGVEDAIQGISFTDIMDKLDWNCNDAKEKRKNAQRLGYILKDLGLKTKKMRSCTWLSFLEPINDRKLKYLFKRYNIGGGG